MGTWRDKYVKRGLDRARIAPGQAGVLYDDFVSFSPAKWGSPFWPLLGGAAFTSGVSGGTIILFDAFDYGNYPITKFEDRWYLAGRAAMEPRGGIYTGIGLLGQIGADVAGIGFMATYSPSMLIGAGAFVEDSNPAHKFTWGLIDNSYSGTYPKVHDFELWHAGPGSPYYVSIDGSDPVGQVLPSLYALPAVPLLVAVGLKGHTSVVGVDKALWLYPEAT